MILLIIDRRLPYVPCAPRAASLLTLPLGAGSVLSELLGRARGIGRNRVLIAPSFEFDEEYERQAQAATTVPVKVLRQGRLASLLDEFEPADELLVVDAEFWPVAGFDAAALAHGRRDFRGATHAIAVGNDPEATRELVDCDENGRVRRVQRLYQPKTWRPLSAGAVCYSRVPARAVGDLPFSTLNELRLGLSSRGVISRDVPFASNVLDLTTEAGLLAANERILTQADWHAAALDLRMSAPQVWVAPGGRIHASARLIGPIVMHRGARIAQEAVIIGPTVIGADCVVERGATVAQSVLASGCEIAAGVAVRHRVLASPRCASDAAGQHEPARPGALRFEENTDADSDSILLPASLPACQDRRTHLAIKRAIDIVSAAVGLILLAPLMLIIAILIKLDTRGPVLFSHRREQRGGREFPCWKFRTMVAGAHDHQRELYQRNEVDGPQFKLRHDPRVTRVGRRLRATNLDELPQLFNVLLGHMSLVGPRPSPFRENQICVPWRRARLSVRPGITGLWQICRNQRGGADFHQWIYYDLMYVRHFSIWLDIKILLATLLTLGGRWRVPLSWMVPGDHQHSHHYPRVAVAGFAVRP